MLFNRFMLLCFCLIRHHTRKLVFCISDIMFNEVHWGVDVCCSLYDKHLCLSFQSKKHANKVRRYISIQNEKEPALKKFKSESSDSVSENRPIKVILCQTDLMLRCSLHWPFITFKNMFAPEQSEHWDLSGGLQHFLLEVCEF